MKKKIYIAEFEKKVGGKSIKVASHLKTVETRPKA